MTTEERLAALEGRIRRLESALAVFGEVDEEMERRAGERHPYARPRPRHLAIVREVAR